MARGAARRVVRRAGVVCFFAAAAREPLRRVTGFFLRAAAGFLAFPRVEVFFFFDFILEILRPF